jgi:hypothetical protein
MTTTTPFTRFGQPDLIRMAAGLATAVLLVATAPALAQTAPAAKGDWERRSPDIHWPTSFTPPEADLFAHNELLINATCETVGRRISDATAWPTWYPNAADVTIENAHAGMLGAGSRFVWKTFGLPIESRVHEYVGGSRIGWFGKGPDLDAYHTWYLVPTGNACMVITEEVVKGPGAIALRNSDIDAMHKGHDLWLETLKGVSEK